MEKLNLVFTDEFTTVKSVLWIISLLSWGLFICTGLSSIKFFHDSKYEIIWTIEKIGQKISAKILQKSTIKSKELEEKVKREIRFSKYFRHPNIIHLYEVIETQNEIIMIMEYASGGELFDLICRGQVS